MSSIWSKIFLSDIRANYGRVIKKEGPKGNQVTLRQCQDGDKTITSVFRNKAQTPVKQTIASTLDVPSPYPGYPVTRTSYVEHLDFEKGKRTYNQVNQDLHTGKITYTDANTRVLGNDPSQRGNGKELFSDRQWFDDSGKIKSRSQVKGKLTAETQYTPKGKTTVYSKGNEKVMKITYDADGRRVNYLA